MIFQNTGLQIADDIDSHSIHLLEELLGIGETLVVPVEGIAQPIGFTGRVARCQPEVINVNVFLAVFVDDLVDFLVTVLFQFCIVHGRCTVSQGLLGRQNGAACEPSVSVNNVGHFRTVNEEQVYITAVCLVVAVAFPVAADFLTHVEHTVIRVVVEQANGMQVGLVDADIEGDMLVHRIADFGIMTDRVLGGHTKTAAFFVQMACLFAKAIEVVICSIHAGVVAESAQLVLFECTFGKVSVNGLTAVVISREGEGGFSQHKLHGFGGETQRCFILFTGDIQRFDPLTFTFKKMVETVSPRGGYQRVGFFAELFAEGYADADDVISHENKHYIRGITVDQPAIFCFFMGEKLSQKHGKLLSNYMPIRSKSSKETVSTVSCLGFAYFTSTARLLWL